MTPSSRTPEGDDNTCGVCGHEVRIEPTRPPGDATCPHCGALLWFADKQADSPATAKAAMHWRRAQVALGAENWQAAERSLNKAASLDPENEGFRQELDRVRQKLAALRPTKRRRKRQPD